MIQPLEDPSEHRYDEAENCKRVSVLRSRGVEVWGPERVYIGPDVLLDNIQRGAILKSAVVTGKTTFLARNTVIGTSGTAVLHDCQLGEGVEVGAGGYKCATMLAKVKVRGFAELRQGTLLEEEAELGHNVGLKHTILTTAVIAGSCINFCDVLATGGTQRSDHSEIGSGTVHFNFDPRGDKFGSLLGDIRGVLLRSRRIFIGGNSGLVAPVHLDFGAVVGAGSTVRGNVGPGQLHQDFRGTVQSRAFDPCIYFDVSRKFMNTAKLVGNLQGLASWYRWVRIPFADGSERLLYDSALKQIELHVKHRLTELSKVVVKLERLISREQMNPFYAQHCRIVRAAPMEQWLGMVDDGQPPKKLLSEYERLREFHGHCESVHLLSEATCEETKPWLTRIPENMVRRMSQLFS